MHYQHCWCFHSEAKHKGYKLCVCGGGGYWLFIDFFFTFAKLWGSDSRLTGLIAYLSTLMQNRNGKLLLMTRFSIFLPCSFTALLCRSLSTFKKIRISVSYWHSNFWGISGFHDSFFSSSLHAVRKLQICGFFFYKAREFYILIASHN